LVKTEQIFLTNLKNFYKEKRICVKGKVGEFKGTPQIIANKEKQVRQFHLPFLQPETYNLQSDNGKVAGEFPLFYFIAACFSNTALALRVLHTFLFLCGIMATYFIAFHFLRRQLLSVFCTLLLFTSPLLVFYGNNFLSDVPALSVSFIGWAIFFGAYRKRKPGWLAVSFLFFTLGALLKASQVINFCILFIMLASSNIPQQRVKLILSGCFLIPVVLWYLYAKSYNRLHHDNYYCLNIAPIWELSFYDIGLGIWRMVVSLSNNYFWRPVSLVLLGSVYFLLKHRKKLERDLRLIMLSSFLLTIIYILLFYQKMIAHEYYYIPFFAFVLFGIIGLLKIYNAYHAENIFAHSFAYIFLIINIIYCKKFVEEKLTIPLCNGYLSSNEMQLFLEKNGVTKYKSIISLPDDTPNKTLYQLKRKGYTEFNKYPEDENYRNLIKYHQADFLLVDSNYMSKHILIKSYLKDSIGSFKGFILYKIN
jgi:hypothetical protein